MVRVVIFSSENSAKARARLLGIGFLRGNKGSDSEAKSRSDGGAHVTPVHLRLKTFVSFTHGTKIASDYLPAHAVR